MKVSRIGEVCDKSRQGPVAKGRKSPAGDAHPDGRKERIDEGLPSLKLVRHAEPREMGFIGSVLDRDEDRSYIRGRRRCEAVHDHVRQ